MQRINTHTNNWRRSLSCFDFYVVTHSYSSLPFLCTLDIQDCDGRWLFSGQSLGVGALMDPARWLDSWNVKYVTTYLVLWGTKNPFLLKVQSVYDTGIGEHLPLRILFTWDQMVKCLPLIPHNWSYWNFIICAIQFHATFARICSKEIFDRWKEKMPATEALIMLLIFIAHPIDTL